MSFSESPQQAAKHDVGSWKGLLHSKSQQTKVQVFIALLLVSASMTFTQLGFIGIGANGEFWGYTLGLLAPVAIAALLFGKGTGTLFGLLAGGVLYVHARVQPLDLFEHFLVASYNSVGLYAICGFLFGLLFSIALRNDPSGKRRAGYLALCCLVVSIVAVALFYAHATLIVTRTATLSSTSLDDSLLISAEWAGALEALGGVVASIPFDFALAYGVCLAADHIVRQQNMGTGSISVRTAFRTRLLMVIAVVFAVVQGACFVAITIQTEQANWQYMGDELEFLDDQLERAMQLTIDLFNTAVEYDVPETVYDPILNNANPEDILAGYDLSDGTIIVINEDTVAYSYNPAFPVGTKVSDLFDTWRSGSLEDVMQANKPAVMVYRTTPAGDDSFGSAELGYMRVTTFSGYYLLMAMPFSKVFASRQATMAWASILALILSATVYVVATRLLGHNVMTPIDRTNASLAKITAGDLEEVVHEHENVEFTSLSNGINETVGALKRLIGEAERRNERDLATAKAIQESALPRTFPPFPEVDAFDIFATMNAAKEVGGDFFDFFLIDEHTLGFLIADVSGKGIPGALFMMTSKTEIENYLATGMEPAEAIARANVRLCANNDAGMFVTVWAGSLNWETGLLTYVNAGHNYPLLRHGHGGSWEWLKKRSGIVLGSFETAKYRQETILLEPGDELLLYTDGVNEALNANNEEYGNQRLESFLSEHTNLHPRELVRSLRGSVTEWANGAEQSDDVTILALEYGVAPEVTGSITTPATLDQLDKATALVSDELQRHQCPQNVQDKIVVALEELFVNVCNYAYAHEHAPGNVTVSYSCHQDPASITVELRDSGLPFDPVRRDDPTKPSSIQEARIGGLGILMVKRTMDELSYARVGNDNVVVFRKSW